MGANNKPFDAETIRAMAKHLSIYPPEELIEVFPKERTLDVAAMSRKVAEFIETTERFENGTPEWNDYLLYVKLLPGIILEGTYKFIPSTKAEKEFVLNLKTTYETLSQWLGQLVAGVKEMNSDLYFTDKIKLKTRADYSVEVLNLAIEAFPRSVELQQAFHTPAQLWFKWEVQSLNAAILENGLITGKGKYPSPASVVYDDSQAIAGWLNGDRELPLVSSTDEVSAFTALTMISKQISDSGDTDERFDKVYDNFRKKLLRIGRAIDRCGHALTFQDGQPLPLGKSAPRGKNRKGFG